MTAPVTSTHASMGKIKNLKTLDQLNAKLTNRNLCCELKEKMAKVAYIYSNELVKQCNKIPVLRGRVSVD